MPAVFRFVRVAVLGMGILAALCRLHAAEAPDHAEVVPEPVEVEVIGADGRGGMTYADSAEMVLSAQDVHMPLHYKEITERAIAAGWLAPGGSRPEITMNAAINNEIRRQGEKNETPRFFKAGRGVFGLSTWLGEGIRRDIGEHNRAVHAQLLELLMTMPPDRFERVIGELLVEMGLDDVKVTAYSGDGGIDVTGVLPFGGVTKIKVAVQVKRYKANIQRPEISRLRGSLDEHDYGFFITTSDFSSGARDEAIRVGGGKPIVLVNGAQVASLLMEHGIGVVRSTMDVFELDESILED